MGTSPGTCVMPGMFLSLFAIATCTRLPPIMRHGASVWLWDALWLPLWKIGQEQGTLYSHLNDHRH